MNQKLPTVAHIVSSYLFSHGTWIYNQIRYSERWRSIVLCQRTENLDVFPSNNIYSIDSLPKPFRLIQRMQRRILGWYPYFLHAIKNEQANILHAHFGPVGYSSLPLARKARVPLVTTFYGYDLSRLPNKGREWRDRYKSLFDDGQMFLVEGPYMRQQLIQLGCPPEKAHVQHLGVDLNKLPFIPRKLNNDGVINILAAATFTEKKGLPYAIEAFGHLTKIYENVYLTVIGDARDKPEEQANKKKLQNLIKEFEIEDRVTLLGYQPYDKLIEQFYRHHIFLSPSVQAADGDNEGGAPVTIIEASASGMPVVSTTHCDIPNVIRNGVSGVLVAEKDVDALVNALINIITNPDHWENMGISGRAYIEKEFDAKIAFTELEDKYNSLL